VGKKHGSEVRSCAYHCAELYLRVMMSGEPFDVIVHDLSNGSERFVVEAHPWQEG
jgi:hypothetical protein